ncbi:MAG: SDR family oxidoreductase [Capsulimonadales bacterium]|nr:SDR family oxidoreductase [Capsulimonadales bacterium]
MKIENSVVVVTGANRGIGRALVGQLVRLGASRIYAAARDVATVSDLVEQNDGRVIAVRLDLHDPQSIERLPGAVGDANLLINNAGTAGGGSQLSTDSEVIRKDFETNYFGTLGVARALVPVLEANGGGAIVNVLSVVSLASMPALGGYSASKAAAHSLTLGLRGELAARGIAVYGVYPGPVDTDMAKGLDLPKTSAEEVARAILAGVESGHAYILPDPMSQQVYEGWRTDHRTVEAQFAGL